MDRIAETRVLKRKGTFIGVFDTRVEACAGTCEEAAGNVSVDVLMETKGTVFLHDQYPVYHIG